MDAKSAVSNKARDKFVLLMAWGLVFIVSLIAIMAWGISNQWQLWPFSSYQFFPLLGLLAWSLMWTHYVNSAVRTQLGVEPRVLKPYFNITGNVVLVLICLHPGILIYQRFRDGFGLPPHSYESYVAPGMGWLTLLGTVSLLIFLAYELRRWFSDRSWWKYVVVAGDAAMLLIFYHSLRLGTQLRGLTWFRAIWWFYGLTLLIALAIKYYYKSKQKEPSVDV